MARPPKARVPLKLAALQLFVERGVHATGIREIAKHAGCSEAALYRHWSNKDDLVDKLFREHLVEVTDLLQRAITAETSIKAKIEGAVRACYTLYDEQPLVFRFVLLVQHEVSKNLGSDQRTPHDVVIELVEEAKRAGEAKGDAVVLAAALVGVFLQTATYVLYGRLPGPLSTYTAPVTATALKILK
ncbi:MAG: TetR/AcrR family transcriptional regulator [Planctomycetes bacterium]|nr:TetR/AcrR family transcriptional regulator [Planctomycetota bacterium]